MSMFRKSAFAAFSLATVMTPVAAIAEEPAPEPIYVCTAEQVLGPFLVALLPITFSPEAAALLGVDPAECVTRLE